MKLGDMTDREIIIYMLGEIRACKKLLTNHLAHHEKQDDRRWKLHVALAIAGIGTITTIALVLL